MKTLKLVVVLCLASSFAQAAGFQLDLAGARALGMGDAVGALVDDASAVYFNPSGLAGHKGLDVSLGVSLVIPSIAFKSDNSGATTSTLASVVPPINAFLSYGITKELSVGVGLFNPFGAGVAWPSGWEGAGLSLSSSVQTFDINPTIAYAIHPRFKLAVGFQAIQGSVLIERGLNFVDSSGKVTLGGSSWGFGWNAGFQAEIVEQYVFIGGTYRTGAKMGFKGRAHFSNIPLSFQSVLKDQAITADVTLPDTASFSIGVKPTSALRIGAQVTATTWDSFHDLTIAFTDSSLTNPLPKKWDAMASFAIGAEYCINPDWAVRLGFVYDPTPSPHFTLSPDLPDATRYKISVGGGWTSTFGLSVDLAYQLVLLSSQRSTVPGFSGSYSGVAHIIGLSVNYHL